MRHRKKARKLSREKDQRTALLKSLVSSLFLRGRIITTEAKAKSAAPVAEKLITKAKQGSLGAHREVRRTLSAAIASKLMKEIASKFKDRNGGYTRIIRVPLRKSDGAKRAILELVND